MTGGLLVLADAPGRTDAVTAIAGAAAALGGLLLVFLGAAVTSYEGYGGEAFREVMDETVALVRSVWSPNHW